MILVKSMNSKKKNIYNQLLFFFGGGWKPRKGLQRMYEKKKNSSDIMTRKLTTAQRNEALGTSHRRPAPLFFLSCILGSLKKGDDIGGKFNRARWVWARMQLSLRVVFTWEVTLISGVFFRFYFFLSIEFLTRVPRIQFFLVSPSFFLTFQSFLNFSSFFVCRSILLLLSFYLLFFSFFVCLISFVFVS